MIESGDIDLDGVDYGFIGGCSFCDNNGVSFTGDIEKHKDGEKIIKFLASKRMSMGFMNGRKLYDIGGFIVI